MPDYVLGKLVERLEKFRWEHACGILDLGPMVEPCPGAAALDSMSREHYNFSVGVRLMTSAPAR